MSQSSIRTSAFHAPLEMITSWVMLQQVLVSTSLEVMNTVRNGTYEPNPNAKKAYHITMLKERSSPMAIACPMEGEVNYQVSKLRSGSSSAFKKAMDAIKAQQLLGQVDLVAMFRLTPSAASKSKGATELQLRVGLRGPAVFFDDDLDEFDEAMQQYLRFEPLDLAQDPLFRTIVNGIELTQDMTNELRELVLTIMPPFVERLLYEDVRLRSDFKPLGHNGWLFDVSLV